MRQRGVNKNRLRGDLQLLVARHTVERPHIVQAVGEFDQNHAHVIGKRKQHFAEVLGLLRGAVLELARNLGQPVDDLGDFFAKKAAYVLNGHLCVLHHVVQQGGHDGRRTQPDFLHHNLRHGQRMVDVRLARAPPHILVRFHRGIERLLDQLGVVIFQKRLGGFEQFPVFFQDVFAFLL